MRVIMIAIGSAGDVFPFIGLGAALTLRGHQVTLCSMPTFQRTIEAHGLAFVPLCDETTYSAAMGDPRMWDPKTSFAVLWQAIAGLLEPVYDYVQAQRHDDIVVIGSLWALGARIAHEKYGFPYLSVQVSPSTLLSAHLPPVHPTFNVPQRLPLSMRKLLWRGIEYLSLDRTCAPQINALRRKHGLPGSVKNIFSQWMHAPQGVICLFPEWFAPVQQDWPQPLHMAGFALFDGGKLGLDEQTREFLDAGPAPIVFTQGSTEHFDQQFYQYALAALHRMGARGIFLTGDRPINADLPPTVLQRQFLPMSSLLPRTAGLVHPGGIGAMSLALAAGIPQIVLPIAHDQFDNAERLVRMGCGIRMALPLGKYDLQGAISSLLHDARLQAACRQASSLMPANTPACETAVKAIEQCHARHSIPHLRQVS
ncbi:MULTISPECIES: glycosyltransferase [unclassified Pseudomonas]|uniref:glycosyltransferase n=1 Tax=Pseudomonas imrae TaxID=2992837 RepID=UPI003965903A